MTTSSTAYNNFLWRKEWMVYEQSLPEMRRRIFSFAVMMYGCREELSHFLKGEDLQYFKDNVIPELDRQHEKIKKGLEL